MGAEVPLHDEGAVDAAEDAEQDVEDDFEVVPVAVIADGEEDELAGAEGVHGGEDGGGDEAAVVAAPHGLEGEVVAHFLEAEEDTADGAAEGDGDAGRGGRGEDLAGLGGVAAVFVEEAADDVAGADGVVHAGAFLAD